uniref:Uncharacterized protein n=1 Tax=Glossina austeni TaxID=7395 RepID=A0A1A9VY38_GLOAU
MELWEWQTTILPPQGNEERQETKWKRHIETQTPPYVVRILMAISLLESIIPAIVNLKMCLNAAIFGFMDLLIYESTEVQRFSNYKAFIHIETQIQPYVVRILMAISLLESIIPEWFRMRPAYVLAWWLANFKLVTYMRLLMQLRCSACQPWSKIREFFRLDLVRDLMRTCTKRRPNYDRIMMWLTKMALTLAPFVMADDDNVSYLFMFQFSIVGMALISLASCVSESSVRATAIYWWELYLGLTLGLMRGKIYALTTSLESLSPLIPSPLYTIVCNATLSYYPGVFNFLSTGLYLLCYTFIADGGDDDKLTINETFVHSNPNMM